MSSPTARVSKEVILVVVLVLLLWWIFNVEILVFYSQEFETALEAGFVAFLILFLWSYIQTILTNPGWADPEMEPINESGRRHCSFCHSIQPDR